MADESPPEHSLPSYHEPTPETHRRISREEEAELALLHTKAPRGVRALVTALLLLTILALPIINLAAHGRSGAREKTPGAALLALLPSTGKLAQARSWQALDEALPTSAQIKAAEKDLERESIVSQYLLPRVQSVLTGTLNAGNEQAYPGREGWLFYRPDVDYVTGPAFLDPVRLKHRARDLGLQPDPVAGIVDFQQQLAARGIELLVVPVPTKPAVDGKMLAGHPTGLLENASWAEFQKRLTARGVRMADLRPLFQKLAEKALASTRLPLYLEADTHWRPETMAAAAQALASQINRFGQSVFQIEPKTVQGLGDVAVMLKLPREQTLYRPQTVTVEQVQAGNALWRPDPNSEVLLLGDSFSNIYSLGAMGWGESAGFAEHLSLALKRPIDCILRNSDGAFATREILSRELARGRDRLAGKKLVVWEFAERELAFGDWKLLSMAVGQPRPATFLAAPSEGTLSVQATVAAISAIPRPGTVPYADHICTLHLVDVAGTGVAREAQALAYLWSMRQNVWTTAARLRPGDRISVRLSAWPGDPQREKINRSELSNSALELEEPVWAELAEP